MRGHGGDDERARDLLQELRRLTAFWQGRDDEGQAAADGDGAADGDAPADAGAGGSRRVPGSGSALVVAAAIACLAAWPSVAGAVTKTWVNTPSNDWHTPTNWSPAGVPGPDDDVVISVATPVVSTGDAEANSLTLNGTGALSITGSRTLSVGDGTSSIGRAITTTAGSTLSFASGGVATWTADSNSLAGAIANAGTLQLPEGVDLGGGGSLVNTGTIDRTTGPGTALVNLLVSNQGAVDVDSGTLILTGTPAGQPSTGTFTIDQDAVLAFDRPTGGQHLLDSAGTITGAGTLRVGGTNPSTLEILAGGGLVTPARIELAFAGVLDSDRNITVGELDTTGTSSTRRGTGTLTVTGPATSTLNGDFVLTDAGTTIFQAGAPLTLGAGTISGGHTLRTQGATTWPSGTLNINGTSLLDQQGTLEITGNPSLSGQGTSRVVNTGTIDRTTSTGDAVLNGPLSNQGTVDVDTGTLILAGTPSGQPSTGAFTIDPAAVLAFNRSVGGPHLLNPAGTITGAGTLRVGGSNNSTLEILAGAGLVTPARIELALIGVLDTDRNVTTGELDTVGSSIRRGSGTLTVTGPAASTLNGDFVLTDAGTTILQAAAPLTLGAGTISGGHTLRTQGATTWASGTLTLNDTGLLDQQGTLEITGNPTLSGQATSRLVNTGTIDRTTSTGDAVLNGPLSNQGIVDVDSGTLILAGTPSGQSSSGAFTIDPAAVLAFDRSVGGPHLLGAAGTITGPGTLRVGGSNNSTLDIAAGAGLVAPARIQLAFIGVLDSDRDITVGELDTTGTSSTRRGTGTLTVTGPALNTLDGGFTLTDAGTTIFQAGAPLTLGAGTISGGHTLRTQGATTWASGNLNINGTSLLDQQGTLEITGDQSLLGQGTARLVNTGTIDRTTSAGGAVLDVPLSNQGTVDVNTGTLTLAGSPAGQPSTGAFTIDDGAALAVGRNIAPVHVVAATGSITGAGSLVVGGTHNSALEIAPGTGAITPETVQLESIGVLDLDRAATIVDLQATGGSSERRGTGTLTVTGPGESTIDGNSRFGDSGLTSFAATAPLLIAGGVVADTATVRLEGTRTLGAGVDMVVQTSAVLENAGTMALTPGVALTGGGTLRNLASSTLSRASAGTATLGVRIHNAGTLNVSAGTLVSEAFTQESGTTAVDGTFNPSTATQTGGTLTVGDLGTFDGPLTLQGGTLTGGGTVAGAVTNQGATVSPSPGGALTLTSEFTQTSGTTVVDAAEVLQASGTHDQSGGQASIATGATLAAASHALSGGTTAVAGTIQGPVTLSGGTLSGDGAVDGALANTGGTVVPGASPGRLDVIGDFTQLASGTLVVEIAGRADSAFDHVVATGAATLDGTLAVTTDAAFTPVTDDSFHVVRSASRAGEFATLLGDTLPDGRVYELRYAADGARLAVVGAPSNLTAPSIPDPLRRGDTATCNPGTWGGAPAFAFQWLRDGAPIAGATAQAYTVAQADVGRTLRCRVTATNASGAAQAQSNAVVPTAPPADPPPPAADPPAQAPPAPAPPAPPPAPSPPPVTPAAPAPPPAAQVQQVTVTQIASLPSARRCVSRRRFRIRLRTPRGERVVRADVSVNNRRVKIVRGRRLIAPVDLRGLPKGRFSVTIQVTTASGKKLRGTRRYRTCTPKRSSGRRGPKL